MSRMQGLFSLSIKRPYSSRLPRAGEGAAGENPGGPRTGPRLPRTAAAADQRRQSEL